MTVAAAGTPPAALTQRPAPLRMLWITVAFGLCFLGVRWGLRDA